MHSFNQYYLLNKDNITLLFHFIHTHVEILYIFSVRMSKSSIYLIN